MSTGVAIVITVEAVILTVLVIAWACFDGAIRAWEDGKIRKIKRWICGKLAEDGIWAEVRHGGRA